MTGSRKKSRGKSPKHKRGSKSKKAKVKQSSSEVDFETLVKEEYTRLHRQYRLMENTRHAIAGASGRLSKQGHILSQLREEKESIGTDLLNATCKKYQNRDKKSIKTILHALERYEAYILEVAHCVADMKDMEENVDKITKRLIDQKLKVQALFGQALTISQVAHKTSILENRLYLTTTQFDTLVSNNHYLKDEINMMLKLRGQVFRRLMHIKKNSASIKSKMGGVVYEASQAYEQRDDWVNKTMALRDKNEKDSRQHVLEIKEFQRVLHHDSKIHNFMKLKNVTRDLMENNQQRAFRKNTGKIAELNKLLGAYRKAFRTILKMSVFRDVESLVVHYLSEEQNNYSVFKYVTDLNNEVNWLKESIEVMKAEIEELNDRNQEIDVKNEIELQQLEEELSHEKMAFQEVAQHWKSVDMTMESFGVVLDQTFTAANCTSSTISSMLGNSLGMRPSNICMCLSILERRVTDLLAQRSELEVRRAVEIEKSPLPKRTQLWQPGVKPKPVGGPFKPKVLITGRLDTEQDDEDAESMKKNNSPCYYDELRHVLIEQVREKKLSLGPENSRMAPGASVMDFTGFNSATNLSHAHLSSSDHLRDHHAARLSADHQGTGSTPAPADQTDKTHTSTDAPTAPTPEVAPAHAPALEKSPAHAPALEETPAHAPAPEETPAPTKVEVLAPVETPPETPDSASAETETPGPAPDNNGPQENDFPPATSVEVQENDETDDADE